jgi:hypothetical protein
MQLKPGREALLRMGDYQGDYQDTTADIFATFDVKYADNQWIDIETQVIAQNPSLSREMLNRAFGYLSANESSVGNKNYLTVIDFDLPSTQERMFVINLKNVTVTSYLVAHGKNSGDNYATQFSNEPESNMSSLGIYLTGAPYIGKHGLSMTLLGKEATNSNAQAREIVLHGADYVSESSIQQLGRLGRSLGCPAVNPQYSSQLVNQLQGGSVFLIYHSPE